MGEHAGRKGRGKLLSLRRADGLGRRCTQDRLTGWVAVISMDPDSGWGRRWVSML